MNEERPNLKKILEQQVLLEEERETLKREETLRQIYSVLNECYWKINGWFVEEYGFQLSFNIFRKYVDTNFKIDSINDGNDNKTIDIDDVYEFFGHSFNKFAIRDGKRSMHKVSKNEDCPYKISEIERYSFDYTFITGFNDILFEIKSLLTFDVEISAGSSENNRTILGLLQEHSSKTVLVKNIHFLPPVVKTGTNRCFYIIEPGESHSLMAESRVVYVDRNRNYEFVYSSLTNLFDGNSAISNYLIKFHSIGIALGLDLSLKDLEICIKNSNGAFSKEFLIEMVYYSKMTEKERRLIEKEMKSKGFIQ
ncbi:uncharacterized protein VICG_00036 [Vittaforma corneae ATCC 50505]|uniref:Uncharacterized protein n=1 Tax=Vittaforma corneae (strain ATCC 50505) TaxID=993615 RepID=L2GPG4_VITCO|nr:uncharacterized protein VICG_00036 [Vittaforma corneae ATCC 50505]ELA42721.1 hypothetical protein VICG_00036 [Vittaforma corneae ATCC 50505]